MLAETLKKIRKQRGFTQESLAKKANLSSHSIISDIESGRIIDPGFTKMKAIAKALRISMDELAGIKMKKRVNPLPVISKVIGSPEGAYYTDQDFVAGAGEDYYNVDDENAFVLTVEGDSMEPTIRAGDRVIITPNKQHKTGDICIVRLADTGKTFLKRIEIHGDNVLLKSENSRYETMVYKRKEIGFIYRVEAIIPR
jgi:SOS-response transcriptional repressor LexA